MDDTLEKMIRGAQDPSGRLIRDLPQYIAEYDASFQYAFVEPEDLVKTEQAIVALQDKIFALIGGIPPNIKKIRILETMRLGTGSDANGVWKSAEQMIVVKRMRLKSLATFAGILLHETT